jgi:hypothetical protein
MELLFGNLVPHNPEEWTFRIKSILIAYITLWRFTELPPSNGYLMVEANGGLNQQRLAVSSTVIIIFRSYCYDSV